MVQVIDLAIDVSEAAALGEAAQVALTVHLPDAPGATGPPTVCFAKPGGGYSRRYFTEDLPGPGYGYGSEAHWHAERGWIVVAVDHLGAGDSTDHEAGALDLATVAAASEAAEQEVLARLAAGSLAEGFPPVTDPLRIGIGQSLGGCLTIVQQARHRSYDGIGVLGYSAIHTHPPARPGERPIVAPWVPLDGLARDPTVVLNAAALVGADVTDARAEAMPMAWGFYYDDVDAEVVARDLDGFPSRHGDVPAWASATVPGGVGAVVLTPGIVAPEAAAVSVPVLVAVGERDVVADPMGEPRAYRSATSIDLFVCPRMGHMHNFAGTRELFWRRLETWAAWVGALGAPGGPGPLASAGLGAP
jgi:alpha-beta hydrolase superfamily lysophospholipase